MKRSSIDAVTWCKFALPCGNQLNHTSTMDKVQIPLFDLDGNPAGRSMNIRHTQRNFGKLLLWKQSLHHFQGFKRSNINSSHSSQDFCKRNFFLNLQHRNGHKLQTHPSYIWIMHLFTGKEEDIANMQYFHW